MVQETGFNPGDTSAFQIISLRGTKGRSSTNFFDSLSINGMEKSLF